MSQVFLEGFLLQASLIFALGAQNLFVLESGLKKQYHLTVSFVCFLCDLSIIMLGVVGAATFFSQYPGLKILIGVLGIIFMIYYGIGKLCGNESEGQNVFGGREATFWKTVMGAITFSVINPHAYLDGIILIGGYSSKFNELSLRILLGLGAAFCSLVWFLTLSSASTTMMPILKNPRHMKLIMSFSGFILVILSLKLGMDVYGWIQEILNADSKVVLQIKN